MPAVAEATHTLNLSGGLNTVDPPAEIQDNQLLQADNLWYLDGKLCKRPGFLKGHSASIGSTRLTILGFDPNSFLWIIASGTALYRFDMFSGSNPTATTGGAITQNPSWMIYVAGTTYVGFDGSMGVRTLSGAGVLSGAAITNSPQSEMAVYHKARIFTNVLAQPGRIAFSDPITPTAPVATWQTTAIIDVNTADKDIITGFAALGDVLLIFFRNSTWILYVQGTSPADWVIRRIHNAYGAAPSRGGSAVYVYENDAYFISRYGVIKTNGSSFVNLSETIWDPRADVFQINYNVGVSGNWRVTRWNDSLIVIGCIYSSPDIGYTYILNLRSGAWTKWVFLGSSNGFFDAVGSHNSGPVQASVLASFTSGASNKLYVSADNFIANYDAILAGDINVYTDDLLYPGPGVGLSYTATFKTKEFQTTLDKFIRIKWAGVEYKAYVSPNFNWVRDNVVSNVFAPGFNSTRHKAYRIPGAGRGRSFALVGSSDANSPWEMDRVNLHVSGKDKISKLSNV